MTTDRLTQTLSAIDNINRQDPNLELYDGQPQPKELLYAQRMSHCLASHWPNADELLQIAVRAQHIKRWSIKRSEFEAGKIGYLKWRKAQAIKHAQMTEALMIEQGYSDEQAAATGAIIRKEKLKSNTAAQTLEDVACLVFMSDYFGPFAAKHSEEKIIRIVQKTWKKMSDEGQAIALKLDLPEHLAQLIAKALS